MSLLHRQDAASLAEHAASKVETLTNQIALLKRTLSATQDAVQSEQKMTAMLQQKLTASREVCERVAHVLRRDFFPCLCS